jgi:hypothetical protein
MKNPSEPIGIRTRDPPACVSTTRCIAYTYLNTGKALDTTPKATLPSAASRRFPVFYPITPMTQAALYRSRNCSSCSVFFILVSSPLYPLIFPHQHPEIILRVIFRHSRGKRLLASSRPSVCPHVSLRLPYLLYLLT